jgi:hypothetical protein
LFETIRDYLTRKPTTDLEFSYRGHQAWRDLDKKDLTPADLLAIQYVHGYDVANWILYKYFRERENFAEFQAYLDLEREMVYSRHFSEYVVFAVAHNPWTPLATNEAYQWDMKNLAVDAGFDCSYPEIPYRRSIFPNAYYYQDLLKRFSGRKVIFMTQGLAALEVRWLLERSSQLNIRVAGWLNISGMLYGTGLPPSRGAFWQSLKQLINNEHPVLPEVARSNAYCYGDFKFNLDFPMVSMLGFQPTKNLSLTEMFRDRELRHWGPHDGYVTHADYLKNPGIVWPVIGHGHYIETKPLKQNIQAALKWIVERKKKVVASELGLKTQTPFK